MGTIWRSNAPIPACSRSPSIIVYDMYEVSVSLPGFLYRFGIACLLRCIKNSTYSGI